MFLSLREMEQRKVRFEVAYPPGEIEFLEKELRQTGPLRSSGSAELIEATQEIRVLGRLEVAIEAACDRCLEPAGFPIDAGFDLLYRPERPGSIGEEIELHESETGIGYYRGGGLDLKEILREQVLLALPMQRVCSQACKGICPLCGQNRNERECHCRRAGVDDRWAALRLP